MAGVITTTTKQAPKTDYQRHWMFAESDDKAMLKQIEETHFPDNREFDVKPIIQIIEDILRRATSSFDGVPKGTQEHVDTVEDKTLLVEFDLLFEQTAHLLHKISCEISCKFSGRGDAHATIMTLLRTLSIYSWDAKLVLTIAAFAVNYGEFSLISQLRPTNSLAKSVAFLKQLPDIEEHSKSLKPQFEALSKLIEVIIDVTKCIVEIKELPSQYISDEKPPLLSAKSYIPTTTYWTIRGILACSTQIASLIGRTLGHEYTVSSTEAWELSSLVHQINIRHQHLTALLTLCHQQIDEKMRQEKIEILIRITRTPQLDNMKLLKELLYPGEELVIGTTKKKINIEVLRRKHVILLISGLDIHQDEIIILNHYQADPLVKQGQKMHYEMVWFPIVDNVAMAQYSLEENRRDFERLQSMIIWNTVLDPFAIEPAVIEFVKNIWHFEKRTIAVSLDPQGKVASENALPMMWIWANLSFPFSKETEEALWKSAEYAAWRLELLADSVDPRIIDWMTKENTFICLYGGDDIEWIRKFTTEAKAVAKNAKITLELFYVGKNNVARERMRKITEIIAKEELSDCWTGTELKYMWYFWVRLESMLYSKMQSKKTAENDALMKELMTVHSFNGGEQGWAVVCRSLTDEMARGNGEIVLKSLQEFEKWKEEAANNQFVLALRDHMEKLHTPEHCTRLILPGTTSTGGIPPDQKVVCAVCYRPMERYLLYRCCTD
ncbi:hypothetical protein F2P56_019878 [Juglans regia]|uniref:Protein SIEVE ELEMENT OCCLUSION B-like n=2 Tax=Juglans regia TaxID=51240 RepID=A0A833UX17_JUGRE|nr:protein SIEVE ELEMENT OCCLUSION B-like [Juglans regia]KAF5459974.1 hypothetical protein F2P56_019878 [Juglans regia]